MRLIILFSMMASSAVSASALGTIGSTRFDDLSIPRIREQAAAAPQAIHAAVQGPSETVPEKIGKLHLLPLAEKRLLLSFPKTLDEHKEFVGMWSRILKRSGFTPGADEYKDQIASYLHYASPGPLAVREFMADTLAFNPLDEADIRANLAKASTALQESGLPVISRFLLSHEYFIPTYMLYYLTEYKDRREDELRLRVLKADSDIDASVLAAAGIKVVQQVQPWLVVYIGKEVGLVTRAADTPEDLKAHIEEFRKLIAPEGGSIITAVTRPLPPDAHRKFGAVIYFYR